MSRLIHAVFLGLLGAGIVHIIVLMLVPNYSQRDAWSALAERSNFYILTQLNPPGVAPLINSLDPLFDAVACRFDLSDGPMRVHASGEVPYWSLSVYDRVGQNVYSVNDRASADGSLDFVVASPAQMVEMRNDLPAAFERSVFIEANVGEGIVVLRAFVPDESWRPTVTRYLQGAACEAPL